MVGSTNETDDKRLLGMPMDRAGTRSMQQAVPLTIKVTVTLD